MNKEREKAILEIAIKEKTVTVKDLSARLFASEPSVRRDLCSLEKQKLLKRTHGGAVLDENALSEIKVPFLIRELEKSDEKIQIARKAAALVPDDSVVFLDASTSAYVMIPFLAEKHNIIVITNGIKTLMKLSESNVKCIGTGGNVVNSCLAFVGEDAYTAIEKYNADFCFFSCRGLSPDKMLTDISQPENAVRLKMIQHSARSYLLCTSNKINRTFYHNLCRAEDITGIIKADAPDELTEPTLGQTNRADSRANE